MAHATRRNGARRALSLAVALAALLPAASAFAAGGRLVPLMQPADLAFWAIAALTVVSAAGVAFSRNIVYSAFSLLGTFLGVAGLFVFLAADFLAVAQVLIYIGGVLVLVLFAVMLTSRIRNVRVTNQSMGVFGASLATAATAGLLGFVALFARWDVAEGQPEVAGTTAAQLGELFLGRYLLPFEIASVVLLATLIGAVVIARKEIKPD